LESDFRAVTVLEDPVPVYEERPCSRHAHLYGWFTDGFDTADPKEAKAVLEELG
jgi:hypothetical protein